MLARLQPFNANRFLAVLLLLLLITVTAALATLVSGAAAFLSVWLVALLFGIVGLMLLAWLPAPTVALERTGYGLLLAFVFLSAVWPRYATFRLPGTPAISPTRLTLLILFILGFYLISKSQSIRTRLMAQISRFRLVFIPLMILLLIKLVGAFFADVPFLSLRGWVNEVVSVYVPMCIALAVINSRRDIHLLLLTLLAATAIVLAVSMYEYRLGRNIFFGILEIDSDYMLQVLRDKLRGGAYRLQSTFAHPLTLSEYLVLMTPVAIYMAFSDGFRWLRSLGLLFLLSAITFVVVKTGSRSGMGSLAAAMAVCAIVGAMHLSLATKNSVLSALYLLATVALLIVAAIGLYLLIDLVVGRTTREFNSGMVRLEMWQVGLAKAWRQPILGYGQDTAAVVLGFVGSHGVITIDSYFLSVLLDGGFFALFLYSFAIVALISIAVKHGLKRDRADLLSALFVGTIIAFALIKTVLSLNHNHVLFMVLMAAMLAGISMRESDKVATVSRSAK